ncbi:carbohydrate kinase [Loktanella sp. 3ANDIMAR09]|uniref:ribokinase n=1 Tax=Loktanella sp. 3ANDIMAR09 TaxID=1225657 RepID=UPI0006FA47C3|nr:ribokinase [Loktanella sp. 3ANDIMAR09]KQI66868.1 carbohydrate kinase [Loktanella sp. 3ANDIMAR09]
MSPKTGIVVVGSLHYDIFVDAPHRPDAGETVTGHSWHPKFGGKGGNQAVSAARAGGAVTLVSAVGSDEFGRFVMARLDRTGVGTEHVSKVDGLGTGMSVAVSDASGDYGAVIVSGANLAIDPSIMADDALWSSAGYLILQNEVPETVNIAAAAAARSHGVTVCLNAAPWREMSDTLLDLIDILVVNALEAEAMCDLPVADLSGAKSAAAALSDRFKCTIVTAGGSGIAFATSQDVGTIPGEPVEVVSTHGAGDHFIGHFIACCSKGATLYDALAAANSSAAKLVSGSLGGTEV